VAPGVDGLGHGVRWAVHAIDRPRQVVAGPAHLVERTVRKSHEARRSAPRGGVDYSEITSGVGSAGRLALSRRSVRRRRSVGRRLRSLGLRLGRERAALAGALRGDPEM